MILEDWAVSYERGTPVTLRPGGAGLCGRRAGHGGRDARTSPKTKRPPP